MPFQRRATTLSAVLQGKAGLAPAGGFQKFMEKWVSVHFGANTWEILARFIIILLFHELPEELLNVPGLRFSGSYWEGGGAGSGVVQGL